MQIPIYASDQLFQAKDYKDLVVVYRNGAPVRLSDLGRVIDGNEDVRNLGIVNGNPMVQIQINRQPNANIVDTVARIKALMPQFEAQLPPTVRFKIASDRTITTRDSMQRCPAQHDHLHRAGDFGGVRLPAQRLVDVHSERSRCRFPSSPRSARCI